MQLQVDDLGIDYIDKRNGLIEAVTLEDVRRVAKRLLDTKMLVAVAGKGQGAVAGGVQAPRLCASRCRSSQARRRISLLFVFINRSF